MSAQSTMGLIGAAIACGGVLWRLANSLAEVRSQCDRNKEKIDDLKLLIEGTVNQLKERVDHGRNRLEERAAKIETGCDDLDFRLDAVEDFLNRSSTTFKKGGRK
jgi:ABC-type transporter Mla subunit MlaD